MRPDMVLALIICKIFLPWVPLQSVHFLGNFVPNPEKSHFHRSGTLTFDGVIRNAYCSCIVAMHGGLWLRMAHFGQGESKYDACLIIMVKGAEFRFRRGRDDEA